VFGDAAGNVIHLNERECSAQRRYQKVLEESPSPLLGEGLRAAMGEAAVQAARAIDYVNAGTVEFIVASDADGRPSEFFFMEINTRLQVEHPVTEMTTGLDLVEWQLLVASGAPLPLAQDQVPRHGHAIEVRLYAEDPGSQLHPRLGHARNAGAAGTVPATCASTRAWSKGDTVSIFYDPMIAKLVVWDEDRPRALSRLRDALAACDIVGPKSNVAFLERLVRHRSVVDGSIDTGYLDRHLEEFMPAPDADPALVLAAATAVLLAQEADSLRRAGNRPIRIRPGRWPTAGAWDTRASVRWRSCIAASGSKRRRRGPAAITASRSMATFTRSRARA
jgi:3-methylcrotonyl-CoA carboxylase alpha subunit